MSKNKLCPASNKISKFINSLNSVGEMSSETDYDMFFSLADEGTLFLSGKESIRYRECLKFLIDTVGNESISPKAIETLYQKTILTVLDIHEKRRDWTFQQRLDAAINELKRSLNTKPTTYYVYYPIFGLKSEGLPIQIGNVQFCIFDDIQLERVSKLVFKFEGDEKIQRQRLSFVESIKNSEIVGIPVGLVRIEAYDNTAAKKLALKEISLTIDVLNFFSDIIPYQDGYIFLPGQSDRLTINLLMISEGENPVITFGNEVAGPITPFSLQNLLDNNDKHNWGFTKISNLLAKTSNTFEDRIITAMQWAGKATIERNKEVAFLLFAISLESLILCNEKDELIYRLRTRVAHLLGDNLEDRQKISKNIGNIYNIRSKIVHSGNFQVTDPDLSLINRYSKYCILHLLNDEPFSSMDCVDSLVHWFDEKILK